MLKGGSLKIRGGKRLATAKLDATDSAIMEILSENARTTNLEIAEKLSVSPMTVSSRIAKLEKMKAMRIVAVSDFAVHGLNALLAVGIKVRGRPVTEVGRDMAVLPEVLSVHVMMMGDFDIELLLGLDSFEGAASFVFDRIAKVPGVVEIDPGLTAEILKYEFNVAPL